MTIHHNINFTIPTIQNSVQTDRFLLKAPLEQTMKWENWSGNVQYTPTAQDVNYYHMPTNFYELNSIISKAKIINNNANADPTNARVNIRVSGQRHSVTPLIVNDDKKNKQVSTAHGATWVIDLACYKDLGKNEADNIVLNKENSTVTVNTGVTETELDTFLSANGYMLKTVTAGGFFSIGGITSVDVHGASMNESIFSSNVIAYTVLGSNGKKTTYTEKSNKFKGYNPLQFYRTSLGTLGVVTSVTIKVSPRAYQNTLVPSDGYYSITGKQKFIDTYSDLLFSNEYNSVESFYNPYASIDNILALKWKIDPNPIKTTNNTISTDATVACHNASNKKWGAPLLPPIEEKLAEIVGMNTQNSQSKILGCQPPQSETV